MQTAQAIADELGISVSPLDHLLPSASPSLVLGTIQGLDDKASLLLVGHNPLVSSLVSVLLHGPSAGSSVAPVALRTGQMASIDFPHSAEPGVGRLLDMLRYEPVFA